MSSVTFDVAVGGDGSTVTDDNNATTGLRDGGWKTRFVPCFTQQVAVANYIVTKAGEASTSASAALASATAAAASYDSFDDRYLGSKTSDPSVDNDGNALITGAIYWNSSSSVMKVWSGSSWVSYNPAISYLPLSGGTMTGAITFASGQTISGYLPSAGGTMTGNIVFASGQTVANLASGSAGTIPYQSASNTTAMLSAGTSGQVLQSNGAAAPSWVNPSAGALTLLTTVTASNSTTVDITTGIDSTYDKYIIDVINMTPDATGGNAQVRMRTSSDGGITFDAAASNYNYQMSNLYSGSYVQSQNDAVTQIVIDNNGTPSTASIGGLCFSVSMFTPSNTTKNKVFTWTGGGAINITPAMGAFWGSGSRRSTSAINAVRFLLSTGNIASGTFRLYGVKTS